MGDKREHHEHRRIQTDEYEGPDRRHFAPNGRRFPDAITRSLPLLGFLVVVVTGAVSAGISYGTTQAQLQSLDRESQPRRVDTEKRRPGPAARGATRDRARTPHIARAGRAGSEGTQRPAETILLRGQTVYVPLTSEMVTIYGHHTLRGPDNG
jgi:hypothetical protein